MLLDLYYRAGNNNEVDDQIIETALADFECRYGDFNEGDKILSRVIAAGNATCEALLLKGRILVEAKRDDQARNLLLKAQHLMPENPLPSAYLAVMYLEQQQFSRLINYKNTKILFFEHGHQRIEEE